MHKRQPETQNRVVAACRQKLSSFQAADPFQAADWFAKRVAVFRLPLPIFCPRRRFAAYHEQGQAPAPRAASTIRAQGSLKTPFPISGCLNPSIKTSNHLHPKLRQRPHQPKNRQPNQRIRVRAHHPLQQRRPQALAFCRPRAKNRIRLTRQIPPNLPRRQCPHPHHRLIHMRFKAA